MKGTVTLVKNPEQCDSCLALCDLEFSRRCTVDSGRNGELRNNGFVFVKKSTMYTEVSQDTV